MNRDYSEAARTLAKIWVAKPLFETRSDVLGLNRSLLLPPSRKKAFEFGVHPAPLAPTRVPRIFQRILDEGHWPDDDSYSEPEIDGTYNLYYRVGGHIPASLHWLFRALRRQARGRPCDISAIRNDIWSALALQGLERLSPFAAMAVLQFMRARKSPFSFFEYHYNAMARSGDPVHTVLLTLLFHEARQLEATRAQANRLERFCWFAWATFLRRPEFRWNSTARGIRRDALDAVRSIMQFIKRGQSFAPDGATEYPEAFRFPICPIWLRSPERIESEVRISTLIAEAQLDWCEDFRERYGGGPRPRTRQHYESPPIQLNEAQTGDVVRILQGIVDGEARLATWNCENESEIA